MRLNLHAIASKWLMKSLHISTNNVPDAFSAGYLGGIIPSLWHHFLSFSLFLYFLLFSKYFLFFLSFFSRTFLDFSFFFSFPHYANTRTCAETEPDAKTLIERLDDSRLTCDHCHCSINTKEGKNRKIYDKNAIICALVQWNGTFTNELQTNTMWSHALLLVWSHFYRNWVSSGAQPNNT